VSQFHASAGKWKDGMLEFGQQERAAMNKLTYNVTHRERAESRSGYGPRMAGRGLGMQTADSTEGNENDSSRLQSCVSKEQENGKTSE
jgi:hypothetical protein